MNKFLQTNKAAICIVILSMAVYVNTIFNDYALDDTLVITDNTFTKKGFKGIGDILNNDGFVGFFDEDKQVIAGGRYRPLAQITFAIEYELFGLNPGLSHFFNLLFYALSCLLLYLVLKKIWQKNKSQKWYFSLPFVAALLFAIHPLHTEAVANIKGRDEIFSLLGALAALYFSLKYIEKKTILNLILVFLSFLFGLFSKENAITFLAVIPLTLYFFTQAKAKDYGAIMLTLCAASAIFLYARFQALGFWIGQTESNEILNDPYLYATTAQRLATVLYTWLIYFKLLFVPYPLTHDYYPFEIPIINFGDIRALLPLAICIFLAYYALKNFRKKDMVAYGIWVFFITFSISSNLLFNVGTFMNERFVYAPLIGFSIIAAYYFCEKFIPYYTARHPKSKVPEIILLVVVIVFSIMTIQRNRVWKDDLTLFTTDVKTSPNSAKVTVSAGGKLTEHASQLSNPAEKQKELLSALKYLHKGIELYPQNNQAWFLLGNAQRELSNFSEALHAYKNALVIRPDFHEAQNNLLYTAQQARKAEKHREAVDLYVEALKYYEEAQHWTDLADSYLMLNKIDSAELILNLILNKSPENIYALNKKAQILVMHKQNPKAALNTLLIAYQADSTELSTNENMGIVYGMMGNCKQSIYHILKALEKEPENTRIQENLKRTYAICGIKP